LLPVGVGVVAAVLLAVVAVVLVQVASLNQLLCSVQPLLR
jgi:hypothetical protein